MNSLATNHYTTDFAHLETSIASANPPHTILESAWNYSIVLNLLGFDRKDLEVDVHLNKREITVLARKRDSLCRRGFYWVFVAPSDGSLEAMQVRHSRGVLEISIPKTRASQVIAA